MKTNNQTLSFSPKLPDKWNSYSFNINYRENKLKVEVNKDGVNITNLEGNDIEINVYDKKYIVKNKEYIDALKDYQGDLLLAGINYDKKTKKHSCIIEKWNL